MLTAEGRITWRWQIREKEAGPVGGLAWGRVRIYWYRVTNRFGGSRSWARACINSTTIQVGEEGLNDATKRFAEGGVHRL